MVGAGADGRGGCRRLRRVQKVASGADGHGGCKCLQLGVNDMFDLYFGLWENIVSEMV